MSRAASRFAECPAWAARLLIAFLLLVSAAGAIWTVRTPDRAGQAVVDLTDTDLALYQAIAGRVGRGEDYYEAAVLEQRARGYPLRPAFTVRLPTLAWTLGIIGVATANLLLKLLMIVALLAFAFRLKPVAGSRAAWAGASFIAACAMVLLTVPAMTFWHESWAALLIILSIAFRGRKTWLPSVFLGLLAVLFRELALPYLAVMAFFAWRERGRLEAAAWAFAILVGIAAMAAHASMLSFHVTAADPASPGWSGMGGWPFILGMMKLCSPLLFLPIWAIALLVPLALLGWAGLTGLIGERIAILLFGYIAAFMLLGRPDNFYWGLLIAPLLPVGLAFAPRALRDLGRNLEIVNRRGRILVI